MICAGLPGSSEGRLMDIKVISLSQEVSFEDGSITNILLMQLPSGRPLRAVITDASAKMLYEDLASVKVGAPHVTRAEPEQAPQEQELYEPPPPQRTETNEEGAVVFGGDDGGGDEAPAQASWMPGEAQRAEAAPPAPKAEPKVWTDPDAQQRAYRDQQAKQKKNIGRGNRERTVPKNERGYPMPQGNGGAEVEAVVGHSSSGTDEEGVGQI